MLAIYNHIYRFSSPDSVTMLKAALGLMDMVRDLRELVGPWRLFQTIPWKGSAVRLWRLAPKGVAEEQDSECLYGDGT